MFDPDFLLTCPNPKCSVPQIDDGRQACRRCGCHLFPVRAFDEPEGARTFPDTEQRRVWREEKLRMRLRAKAA